MNQQIRLFGAMAVRPAVLPLISRFEAATGCRVAADWALNPTVKKEIDAGQPFDLVLINPSLIDDLVALGKVRPGSRASFGRIAMGVATAADHPPFDTGSVEAFRDALKGAASIAYASEGTSGGYFVRLLERLGIADDVKPRLVAISGDQTAPAVGRGEAELGVVPITSILAAAPDVRLTGRFPAELQSYIDFAIGISAQAEDPKAARQFSDFLVSPDIDVLLAAKGVERMPEQV